ncbi:alpha-galactosidase [Microbacteriaceae bacterium VKM Ac-2855]|nr:alpha-galactosidase [Microbacteriaceae bacterium VKM Ac-2855]
MEWDDASPARFGGLAVTDGSAPLRFAPFVEIFTSTEQRARTSQAYVRSAVGERLRVVDVVHEQDAAADRIRVRQRDSLSGLDVETVLEVAAGTRTVRLRHRVTNTGDADVVLTALVSARLGLGRTAADLDGMTLVRGESEWLAEGRWTEQPLRAVLPYLSLPIHEQDGRGRSAVVSHGAWPTGEHLPVGLLLDASTGQSIGWQIESGTSWIWELGQELEGAHLALSGPTDLEHQFAHRLAVGESFDAVPVAIAFAEGGRDAVAAELTRYRRTLRAMSRPIDTTAPVVYNDFMNTLMGDPTTERLLPLIDAAADAGAEYFCVDAGWFASEGDWWDTVGEWQENPERFVGGFRAIAEHIRERGMVAGTWLEPEVVGEHSPAAATLPEDAFFHRFGERVKEHGRYHLDFRHPAAVAHLDAVVDHLVLVDGFHFLKLDYNINPGAGTDWRAAAAGDGLLGHSRAFIAWLTAIQQRHPDLLIENCASGAMRSDYAYLAQAHLQSTSDQQDFLLYPVIAAAAPLTVLPEQAGNWAYPSADMTREETIFTLVTGLAGRFYLSGFLHRLNAEQRGLVTEAVAIARSNGPGLAEAMPFWPLGLPGWDDDVLTLGLHSTDEDRVVIWSRSSRAEEIHLPGAVESAEVVFPASDRNWSLHPSSSGLVVYIPAGPTARVLRVRRG